MGLLSNLDRLEKLKPTGFTIWPTTKDGWRWQANIQLERNGGWHIKFGMTMEEAMEEAAAGALRGERFDVTHTRVEAARDAIRAAAAEDHEEDRPRAMKRVVTRRDDPPRRVATKRGSNK